MPQETDYDKWYRCMYQQRIHAWDAFAFPFIPKSLIQLRTLSLANKDINYRQGSIFITLVKTISVIT